MLIRLIKFTLFECYSDKHIPTNFIFYITTAFWFHFISLTYSFFVCAKNWDLYYILSVQDIDICFVYHLISEKNAKEMKYLHSENIL